MKKSNVKIALLGALGLAAGAAALGYFVYQKQKSTIRFYEDDFYDEDFDDMCYCSDCDNYDDEGDLCQNLDDRTSNFTIDDYTYENEENDDSLEKNMESETEGL